MRLLYLHQYYCPHGGWGNDRSAAFARHWVQRGHAVTVLTTTAYFPPEHPAHRVPEYRFTEHGAYIIVLNVPYAQRMGFVGRLRAFRQFAQRARKAALSLPKPDAIWASSTPLQVARLGGMLARHWRVPWVFECVDVWPQVPTELGLLRNPLLQRYANRLADSLYRNANTVVVLSEGMREQVLARGVQPGKVHVVHNGTDCAAFVPTPKGPSHRAGGYSETVRFLYAGHMGYANDVEGLVHTMGELLQQHPTLPVHLTLVGDGAHRPQVEAALAAIGNPASITLLPAQPKYTLPALFQQHNVGIVWFREHPVLEHNSANKFYDYLAAGLPVLLNYSGWQGRYLRNYQAGLPTLQGDRVAFVRAMVELATNATLRTELGANARRLAVECFDRAMLAERALGVLEIPTQNCKF
jgi:glycosyltransferase involved in cell wall biosynthesis